MYDNLLTMTKNKKKLTSIQKDLMIGLSSGFMFYLISEVANLADKLEWNLHPLILSSIKFFIIVGLRGYAMYAIKNKYHD